jgi:tetratricopeptide (TPR) repeat protein
MKSNLLPNRLAGCLAVLALALGGCAVAPLPAEPETLLLDHLFKPPVQRPDSSTVFRMSDAMRAYADRELAGVTDRPDPRRTLIEALYAKNQLRLAYDASVTFNAEQAFDARAGNCLALVIMTASFARHLGLPVNFQAVQLDDFYSRSGSLMMASGHVNLVLSQPAHRTSFGRNLQDALTIDFLPQDELRNQRTRPLEEETIVAMYFNNRAAELLAADRTDEAYWYGRAAVLEDRTFVSAVNTLGVIYTRSGHPRQAEAAFRQVLAAEPDSTSALSNLVQLMRADGRVAEAQPLAARLERLQPVPPFQKYYEGRSAMAAGQYRQARDLFEAELRLQPYQEEVHFWAAQAWLRLGNVDVAARHLSRAAEFSTSRSGHDRYAAKLDHLRKATLQ